MGIMRQVLAVVLALLCGFPVGCFTAQPEHAVTRYATRAPFEGPTGEDVVQLYVALVERPAGDRYMNLELWDLADEQTLDFPRKCLLEDNGFRMGQIGGSPPPGLQALIDSERSCIKRRHIRLHAGSPTPVVLGQPWTQCRFQLQQEGKPNPVDLEQAQCQLEVVPVLAKDGRVTLRLTPNVIHGEVSLAPRPVHEPDGTLHWNLQAQQPVETYPWLSWECTLGSNELVVVGTRLDRPETLGQRCFLHTECAKPVQMLLVLRAVRLHPNSPPGEELLAGPPPLALQAGLSASGGDH
jgi:hypothetical protein